MTARYLLQDAADSWAQIMRAIRHGEAVELTDGEHPVAVITPLLIAHDVGKSRADFQTRLERLRREYDADTLGIGPEDFEGLRDRSPGRDIRL